MNEEVVCCRSLGYTVSARKKAQNIFFFSLNFVGNSRLSTIKQRTINLVPFSHTSKVQSVWCKRWEGEVCHLYCLPTLSLLSSLPSAKLLMHTVQSGHIYRLEDLDKVPFVSNVFPACRQIAKVEKPIDFQFVFLQMHSVKEQMLSTVCWRIGKNKK